MAEGALDDVGLSEVLARAAREDDRSEQRRRALRAAPRTALRWPIEAREPVTNGGSLAELHVGPWLARVIGEWLDAPARMDGGVTSARRGA